MVWFYSDLKFGKKNILILYYKQKFYLYVDLKYFRFDKCTIYQIHIHILMIFSGKKMKQYLWSYNIIVDIHFKFVCWKKHTKISELSNTYFVIIKIHVFNWYPWAPQMVCNVLQLSAHSCFRLTYDGDVFWNGCAGERYIPCVKCNHFHYM